MATKCEATTNATSTPSTQQIRQRKKQLTTITVLKLAMITVLIQMPANSLAASLSASKTSSSVSPVTPATAVLPSVSADNALSNSHPVVLQQLADSMTSGSHGRRKRLRKRHSVSIRLAELAGMTEELKSLEWLNACGGQQVGSNNAEAVNNTYVRKELILLKKSLRDEYIRFKKLQRININGMQDWRKHNKKYRFLPLLNRTDNIDLSHWHHGLQKFVASFVQLGVQQYSWEQEKSQRPNELSQELNLLLLSAKRVLCNVEFAFNTTNPQGKLTKITNEVMQKKLAFYSRDEKRVAGRGVFPLDLKFAKQRYVKFVQRMSNILRSHLKANRAAGRASGKSMTARAMALMLDYSGAEISDSESFAHASSVAGSSEYSLGT